MTRPMQGRPARGSSEVACAVLSIGVPTLIAAAVRAVKRDAATANLVAHLQAMRRLPQREEPAVVLVMQWLEETLERRGAESRNLSVRVAADLREERL